MDVALGMLMVAGFGAVAWRLFRSVLRLLLRGAAGLWARETAGTRAHRGDLTGMAEAEAEARALRATRRRAALGALFWLTLLGGPALLPWPGPIYAVYTIFWLMPPRGGPWRSRSDPAEARNGSGGEPERRDST